MAVVLRGMLTALGINLPHSGLVLQTRTIVASCVVGVSITVLSAVLPAHPGGKVPPVAAMRDIAIDRPSFSSRRLLSGTGLVAIAALLIALGLTGELAILGVGVALLFLSLFVLGPLIARPVSRALGAPLVRVRRLTGALARDDAMRNPKRTARTAAALMVGVALVAAIAVFASSARASIPSVFAKQFTRATGDNGRGTRPRHCVWRARRGTSGKPRGAARRPRRDRNAMTPVTSTC